MSFNRVLEKYRKISFSERDKGDRFERLMQAYLQTDTKYAFKFKNVWLWNQFPGKDDFGGKDTGIDLVALTNEGDYWAIQCKCYQEDATIDKPSVDTFLSTSSKQFTDVNGKTVEFVHRLWISTTNKWGSNATGAINNQNPPVTRLNLYELQEAPVNWDKIEEGISGEKARLAKKTLRAHQKEAIDKTHEYFKTSDRGKLIMACGTGKTFTALRLAENETNGKGLILFLVPSIALLGQTLREWTADALEPINSICICSDPEISKKKTKIEDSDSFSVIDLALPASTNVKDILKQFKNRHKNGMTVVFSTYQSIDVIAKAQKELLKNKITSEFDLIICDEAHRTTGVSIGDDDMSAFVKVHDNKFLKSKKRIYMTATPRLYSDDAKSKAAEAQVTLCSMDEKEMYGEEIYRIGFGEAVNKGLLTDYKVLILTLNENDIPPAIQKMISDKDSEINTDDASKLIGCINALSKQIIGDDGSIKATDPEPMKRAVAFCPKIVASKKITTTFNDATEVYIDSLPPEKKGKMVSVSSKHIDGTMSAPERDELLGWLKEEQTDGCRILTNVRCLSEGVDVPSLDAVMFLSARNSQVDVVQSVGRVMRKAPNKNYGYIIIPVLVPTNIEADKALDDNERYKVVWTVLNALRAHDDRFNATVNKLELNKKKPNQILVGTSEYSYDQHGDTVLKTAEKRAEYGDSISQQLYMQFEQLQGVVFARMVQKVGDRRYWEQWARNVAEIAERQVERITRLIKTDGNHKEAFEKFLQGLQHNINPSITQQEAVEMLSQHIITKPVFEALFEDYSFVKNNAISVSMQTMLELLEAQSLEKDAETLGKFYESVRMRASGIDNAEGKQRIIIELYDKFFKAAFPKMVEKLGIVYTPVEVVDFIIHSVNDVLKQEFGRSISDENIHILDPFTGTGTFITRLLQSGLIDKKDLTRKFTKELHANEIVLLAYYIAAVNIENAYHELLNGDKKYQSFNGICLTDTFQLGETGDGIFSEMFPQNSDRVNAQKKAPIRVIIGNPPYSVGQKSANDNSSNQKYSFLENRVETTYTKESSATNSSSTYDSYIKAFRWSSDRINRENGGIICFISNGAWVDGNSQDGFRKCIEKEFSSIYVFNTRGNARTSGELRQKEAGNVFGGGSRTPIAITLLVKNPNSKKEKADISYYDIGDYLSREEKLDIVLKFGTVSNDEIKWKKLSPNEQGDWINQRNNGFDNYIPIGDKKENQNSFFSTYSNGVKTNRDPWAYNFSKKNIINNMSISIKLYLKGLKDYQEKSKGNINSKADDYINFSEKMISWTREIKWDIEKGKKYKFENKCLRVGMYRPFEQQHLYFNKGWNNMQYLIPSIFPTSNISNLIICVPAPGGTKPSSVIITNITPDIHLNGDNQCFPLYYYEERSEESPTLFNAAAETEGDSDYIRRDGISDFILDRANKQYGKNVSKEDIFYYVYGFLHCSDYREKFANDLKKMLPRLPLVENVKDFWAFSKAGRKLADLHINYEEVPACPGVKVTGDDGKSYIVEKMRFPKKDQKDTIFYNSKIIVSNIPEKAYEYVVNGKSAIEWIMERYQVTVHKESGIRNDPNDWAKEHDKPRYILDLLLSIINVSVKTVDIVNGLPKVSFE